MKIGRSLQALLLAGLFALAADGSALGDERGSTPAAPVNEEVLYKFCSRGYLNSCTDGGVPVDRGGLVMDEAGNLYGTNIYGGGNHKGTVFRLTPTDTGWSETVLYNFSGDRGPQTGLIMDAAGNLYGTNQTGDGSGSYGYGYVYRLAPSDSGWVYNVLYSFCALSNCADGMTPYGLTIDQAGNLYGVTYGGYTSDSIVQPNVFKLAPTGNGWTETVLYRFCSLPNCADGDAPLDRLLMGGTGNLYGTTCYGGGSNSGIVFKLSPTSSGWTETVLYSFCLQAHCADGALPNGLLMDSSGNLYGTTQSGGIYNPSFGGYGTVFKLTATDTGWERNGSVCLLPEKRLR